MNAVRHLAIFRIEFARLWRQARLRWLAAVFFTLTAAVFLSSWHGASHLASDRRLLAEEERARWIAQGEKDPHSAAHFGIWAVKPSSPLAVLEPGIEPFAGLAVWLEAHKRNDMIFRPQQDADPIMRGAASVGQLIALLGPVVAILLGFAGFAEDRERGTLRMALGNAAAPAALLVVRAAAMLVLLGGVAVMPAALLGALAICTLPDAGWHGWFRLALWSGSQFLYVLGFLFMALAVSLGARNCRAALAVMLACWALLCIVLPRAAGHAAQAVAPLPSYQEVRARTELEAPAYEDAEQWEARRLSILRAHGVTDEKDAPVNMRGAQLDQSERDAYRVLDRLLGGFHDAIEKQDRIFAWLGMLSPASALHAASSAMAGTDFHQHRHFIDAAESYRRGLVNRMNGELMHHAGPGNADYKADRTLWESTPAFVYRPPGPGSVVVHAAVPVSLLLAWCGLAAMLAWLAARRLRP